jgi:ribosomal protein L16 Arg81 hydroxylase
MWENKMINENIKSNITKAKPFYTANAINNLFSWVELERLLNLSPFLNDRRLNIISKKQYQWDGYWWKTDNSAYPTEIVQEEIKHYLCYIQDASRVNYAINQIASELEILTGLPTDAHIFFSMSINNSQGLGIHNDQSDNFIVQIEGETNFKVWDILAERDEVD